MEDREGKIFAERAERIAQKLTKALANEIGKLNDDEFSTDLLMYVLARLSAGALLSIQEQTKQFDIEDVFGDLVKDLMAVLGKDKRIQSLKNERRELERKQAEWEKILAEKDEQIKDLEEEYKRENNGTQH